MYYGITLLLRNDSSTYYFSLFAKPVTQLFSVHKNIHVYIYIFCRMMQKFYALFSFQTNRSAAKLRPRRASQRGCQLGTCQLHNLANVLYHISKTSGKDESKKANDPQGFGR